MPKCSLSRRCCARTSSPIVTFGNAPLSKGGGVLLGDDENPLANCPGRIMKYFLGLMGRSSPMKISIDLDVPDHMCGNRITLSFAGFKVPCVLKASFALGSVMPLSNSKSPSSKYWCGPCPSSE